MKNIDKSYKQRSPIVKSRESETEHRPAMEALQERLQFEKLISDLSALFVNLPASEVDGQIEQGLKRIVEFLGIDRSSFGEFSEDMKELRGTHSYAVPGIESFDKVRVTDVLPWYAEKLLKGEIFIVERPSDLPDDAVNEKAYSQETGMKSHLAIPISIGGSLLCVIAFSSFRTYKSWPNDLVEQLKRVAELFAHTIYRKRAEQKIQSQLSKLEDRFQFERLIADLSAKFVHLAADQIDQQIERGLQQVVEFLGVDRGVLLQLSKDKKTATAVYEYVIDGIEKIQTADAATYPWVAKKINSGEVVCFASLDELPPEAAIDRESWEKVQIKSNVIIPLFLGSELEYVLMVHSVQKERNWPGDLPHRLRLIGEIFVNALMRKRVEQTLRESEKRYFLATSAGRVGVWDWNLDTNEIYVDPMLKAFLGYEDHEIRNHIDDWGKRVHPADRERVMAEATKHLEGASLHYEIEHRMLHKDGSIRWFLARGTAMRDKSGKPYRMLGTDTDITERKQADEALKRSEARLAEAQRTAHLGGWEWDIVKHEVHWSTELYRIFDVDPDEFKPSKAAFLECVHPDDRPYLEECIAAILSNKEPFSVDHRITLPSGTMRFLHSEARMECDAANKPVRLVGIAQDITERKQAEEDARRHREELSHVTRVATMGELAASLAHEINQPLTAILSNAQAAQRFLDGDEPDLEEVGEILLDIAKDGGRASEVIQRLREMVKKGDLERSPLDINSVIHQVIMLVHGDAEEKRASITFDLATGLPPVLGDSVQLQQVVLNLVLNGLEAMSQVEQGSRELVVRTSKDESDTISVAVCDTGIGLHDDVMERIFDPFFTTKPQGMGMGLSIRRSIIAAHGGRLWATKNPDRGATFWFTLPACDESQETRSTKHEIRNKFK